MKKKVIENTKENKKYKTTILKIESSYGSIRNKLENMITFKIKTNDVIKCIDNLEYLKPPKLTINDDRSLLKYCRDLEIKNYDEYIKSDIYKKAVKYLKDNNIGEKLIKDYRLNIYDHLNSQDKDDLLKLKNEINFHETKPEDEIDKKYGS